jgi:hypothetical protein
MARRSHSNESLSLLVCWDQALSQERMQVCSTPSTNLDPPPPGRNSQNIKDKHADQPVNNQWHPTAPTRCLCWTAAVVNSSFSKMCVHARCFVQGYRALCLFKLLILWSWRRRFLRLCVHDVYVHSICIIEHYVCIQTKRMYVYGPAVEATSPTVFVFWLRASFDVHIT